MNNLNQKALLAEFIGTFALIFVGVGAIACDFMNGGKTGLVGIALAHGLTIAVMVSATAAISGGHLNPAVTIGLLCTNKIDLNNAIGYIVAQCLGAITAAMAIKLCLPPLILASVGMGTPALGNGITVGMGLFVEIIMTFFLMFAVYGTAVDKRAPQVGGLFIGLTVVLDILMGGPISGAAMNPARHLGPALMGGGLNNIWIYWIGPIVGAVLAAFCYNEYLMDENQDATEKKIQKKTELATNGLKTKLTTVDSNTWFIALTLILSFSIVIYAIFSPTARNKRLPDPGNARIVIAADGPTMGADVSPTFHNAKYFLVINPLSGKLIETAPNPWMTMQTPNANAAYLVAGKGEEAVLAGNIDPLSFAILSQFGINGFSGFRGSVKEMTQLYRQARINHAPVPIRVNNDQGAMVPVYVPAQMSGNQVLGVQRLAIRQNAIPNSRSVGIR